MSFHVVNPEPVRSHADLTARQSGVAACVLDAMDDEEAAKALGLCPVTVAAIVNRLQARTRTRNRVALALALDRLNREETHAG